MTIQESPLVSVIIPCYNQAHFLGEAIESVLAQTYRHFEIVVVDDGSPDNTSEVAARYPGVRCIHQENQGLPASRNAGARASKGSYLVFLDADDRLLPHSLEAGVNCLNSHPESGLVYGHFKIVASDGSPLPGPPQYWVETEQQYLRLLHRNYIAMIATVMCRRHVFEAVGGFSTSVEMKGSEDYDFYFRVARQFPIHYHTNVIAEYRVHNTSMSHNYHVMLKSTLVVLRSQWKYVKGNKEYEEAYKIGVRTFQDYYGEPLVNIVRDNVRARQAWKQVIRDLLVLTRYYPRAVADNAGRKLYCMLFGVKN